MPDREFKVGEVIDRPGDLLYLPVRAEITELDNGKPSDVTFIRTVNGFVQRGGHSDGTFIPNEDIPGYFEPCGNEVSRLPSDDPFIEELVDESRKGVITLSPEQFEAMNMSLDAAENAVSPAADIPPRAEVLREAEALITGDRNKTYGPPTENFRHIADLLNTRFRHKLKPGENLTGSDVADMMILVKVARNIADPKRDNWVDIAGYAACGHECTLDED